MRARACVHPCPCQCVARYDQHPPPARRPAGPPETRSTARPPGCTPARPRKHAGARTRDAAESELASGGSVMLVSAGSLRGGASRRGEWGHGAGGIRGADWVEAGCGSGGGRMSGVPNGHSRGAERRDCPDCAIHQFVRKSAARKGMADADPTRFDAVLEPFPSALLPPLRLLSCCGIFQVWQAGAKLSGAG